MKKNSRNILLAALLLGQSQAASLYWDGGNGNWLNNAAWSTDSAAITPDPVVAPVAADDAFFNISTANLASTVTLNGNYAARSLTFTNTAATNLSADGINRALSVGAGGITMASGAGTATIGSATANQNVPVTFTASQTWVNNSTNNIVLANIFATSAAVNITKQGTGNVWYSNTGGATISGNLDIQAGKLLVSGDLTWNGVLSGAGTLENGGPSSKWIFQQGAGDSVFSGSIKDQSPTVRLGFVKRNNEGTLTMSGANQLGDRFAVERGTVRLTGSIAAGFAAGAANNMVFVGNTANVNARLLVEGGTLSSARTGDIAVDIGTAANANGLVSMTSGTITSGNAYGIGRAGYGAHVQTSGSLTSGSWLVVGANAGRGVLSQSGGTITVTANRMTVGAGSNASIGVVNLSGGSFTANAGIFLGENGRGILNISGTHSYSTGAAGTTQFAGNASSLEGHLNLNGGTMATNSITKGASTGTGIYRFNFNGGKLKATANSANFFSDLALTDAYVNAGGGTIDNSGFGITLTEALKAPTGNGVSATGLATTGGGLIGTPVVTITGGGGTGATAVANIDGSGNLTGITMTNPGIGYTSAPTFALSGGGFGSTGAITGAATLVANTSGAMTFEGTGTTTIKSAFTYTGGTTLAAGKLDWNFTSGASLGALTIADSAALLVTPPVKGNTFTVTNATFGTSGATSLTANVGDQVGVNITAAPLNVTGNLSLNSNLTINVAGTKFAVGVLPLVSYAAKSGSGSLTLGTLPSGVVATLVDNGSGLIYLNITQVALPRWDGTVDTIWDTTTANWVDQVLNTASVYVDPNPVMFDDLATGVGGTTVTLNSTVAPKEVIYNNTTAKPYTLSGSGKISGSGTLTKRNTGTATISGILNDYTGVTRIEGGTLSVDVISNGGVASPLGAATSASSNLVLAGGTLTYTGATTTTDRGFLIDANNSIFNTTNDLTVTGTVSSGLVANFNKAGAGKLTIAGVGSNTIGSVGAVNRVSAGTLAFDGTSGAQTNTVLAELWVAETPDVPAKLSLRNTSVTMPGWLAVGRGNGDNGVCNIDLINSSLSVGNFSTGFNNGLANNASETFIVQNNSTFTNTGTTNVAESNASTATWEMINGSVYTAGNTLNIGGVGTATGVITVKDTSSIIKNGAGTMVIGNAGIGTLNLENSATLTVGNNETYIGNAGATTQGFLNVKDNATVNFGATTFVGKSDVAGTGFSQGTLNQTGGTVNAATWLVVGRYVGAQGFYNISAGTTNQVGAAQAMIIGEAGAGTLTVSGAGVLNVQGSFLSIAKLSTAVGTVNLNGGSISAKRVIEEAAGGTSTLNFNGGVLKATAASADFVSVDTVDVKTGGAIFDSNGFDITVLEDLAGVGGVTKQGAGTLQLSGALTYVGATTVNGGTLALGSATDLPAATNLAINNGTFDVRNGSSSRLATVADLSLDGATLSFGGNGTSTDKLTATGAVTTSGSNTIKLTGVLDNGTYTLIEASAPLSGSFTLDTSALPPSFTNYVGSVSGNTYTVTVTGSPVPSQTYWMGDISAVWNTTASAPNSNWATSAAGTTDANQIPGAITDVYFSATGATNTTTALGADSTINSLTFSSGAASIGGANALTINATNPNSYGLEVASGASATIALSNLIYANDTKVNAGGTLTVTGSSLGSATEGSLYLDGVLNVDSNLAKAELNGAGTVRRSVAGLSILTIGGGFDSAFSGLIENGTGTLILTKAGNGKLTLSGANTYTGGTNLQAGGLEIGNAAALGTGSLTLSGGTLYNGTGSALNLSNPVVLGGAWTFDGPDNLTLSGVKTSFSQPTVNVLSGELTLPGVIAGDYGLIKNGDGVLNVTGTVTSAATNALGVISFADGITNSSATLNSTGAEIWVGNGAGNNATMNMSGGAINCVNWLAIGRSGGSGTLNMLGGSITKTTITGNIVISGGSASGQTGLLSQSGGTVTNLDSQTWVGESGTGTYTISGSAVADLGLVNVGTLNAVNSVGIVNLDGGTFAAKQIIKGGAAASGTLNFNGGTLKANTAATGATFLQGMSAANVRDGGAIIDTNAQDITIAQLLQHSVIDGDAAVDGGLTKNGAGKLTLSASNTYTGDTTVSAGTLSLAAAALADTSDVIIASGATLDLTHASTDIVDSLTINGVAMANGVYGAIGSGAQFENAAITGSGKLQVGTNPYDSWATSKGLTGGDALSSADPDNDGMVNLMEFFLDGSPTSFTSAPAASAVGSNLSISFKRRDDAEANVASQFVRVSTDLVNWTDVAIPTASGTVSGVTFTIVENGTDADDVTASVPMGADVKKFLGVKVTEN